MSDHINKARVHTMADQKSNRGTEKEAVGAKMDLSEVKDHGFGDIVTLNVGGKR